MGPVIGTQKCSDNTFNNCLKNNLGKIKKENKLVITAGDFNYNLLKYECNEYTNEFINMIGNFFQPCILEPTRIVSNAEPSLINNIFINSLEKIVTSGNLIEKISDHMPNFII